jgi:hypothetical protein
MSLVSVTVAAAVARAGELPVVIDTPLSPIGVRTRENPTFPPEADAESGLCVVVADIDARGRPATASSLGCAEPYATAAEQAVMRWRWDKPRTADGAPATGRTLVKFSWVRAAASVDAPRLPSECSYGLAVGADGALALDPIDEAVACAALVPPTVAPPPAGAVDCTLELQPPEPESHTNVPRTLELDACPRALAPWVADLVTHSRFVPSGWVSLSLRFTGVTPGAPVPEPAP